MAAQNIYHDTVVHALEADGWENTDDPLYVSYGGRDLYVDLAAERPTIGAMKDGRLIPVEIQSFIGPSIVHDLEHAVGQYSVYRSILAKEEPQRVLYLAVPGDVFEGFLSEQFGQAIVNDLQLRLLVFDE